MDEWRLKLDAEKPLEDAMGRIARALVAAEQQGGLDDGAFHKQYAIDQMVRMLTGTQYGEWRAFVEGGEDGPYEWEEGTAP